MENHSMAIEVRFVRSRKANIKVQKFELPLLYS
jgi:hypothetical protein